MTLTIARRFRGPNNSGNGGYVAGTFALAAGMGPTTVTLRTPPPLEIPLDVTIEHGSARLGYGETLVAEATSADDVALTDVPPIALDHAREASKQYAGHTKHPFPECFVCGTERADGDGMRLFPGRLGDGRTACTWTPQADLAGEPAFVWAVLDCPGGWSAPIEGRPMVLGQITAQVAATPAANEACVVMGQLIGSEGRKTHTASTAYGHDGRVLGRARATWIAMKA
jgi:hypothetical protein